MEFGYFKYVEYKNSKRVASFYKKSDLFFAKYKKSFIETGAKCPKL